MFKTKVKIMILFCQTRKDTVRVWRDTSMGMEGRVPAHSHTMVTPMTLYDHYIHKRKYGILITLFYFCQFPYFCTN